MPALFGPRGVLGGAERYALELARHMADATPTTLVAFGDRDRSETLGRLRVHVIGQPWYVRGQRFNPMALGLFDRLSRADVVHCHQRRILCSSLSALGCRLSGRKVFVSDLGGGGWDVSAYLATDRWYDGHLHISAYSRSISGHAGDPWAHVILGGVDVATFSPALTPPSPEAGGGQGTGREGGVLYVGRLLPHKGINDLIAAVPPDLPLELIGPPYHAPYLEHLRRLADGKCVRFRHDCDDADLVRRLPAGHLRRIAERLSRHVRSGVARAGVAGANAAGGHGLRNAGVCTNVASMPEVVEDGVRASSSRRTTRRPCATKLLWLRDHPEPSRWMGEAARRRVLEKFTWPAVVRQLSRHLRSMRSTPHHANSDRNH